jgi:hypothetical protein
MYQYSSFHTYVDCHVTKSKVQAGAVTLMKELMVAIFEATDDDGNMKLTKALIKQLIL